MTDPSDSELRDDESDSPFSSSSSILGVGVGVCLIPPPLLPARSRFRPHPPLLPLAVPESICSRSLSKSAPDIDLSLLITRLPPLVGRLFLVFKALSSC